MFARTSLLRSARTTAVPRHPLPSRIFDVRTLSSTSKRSFENIIVSPEVEGAPGVSLITLNRPKALNALNSALFTELNQALSTLSADDACHCVVLTGSSKAFAAGADIKEMKDKEFAQVYKEDFLSHWTELTKFRKPIVAAVSGYAVSTCPPFHSNLASRVRQ